MPVLMLQLRGNIFKPNVIDNNMQLKRKIKFEGKNLNDVFGLPCVKAIFKVEAKPVLVLMITAMVPRSRNVAEIGDTLVQYEDGTWEVMR